MLRATKVRIYPTIHQAEFINAQFGAVRFAFNKALAIKIHEYKYHGVNLSPKKDLKPLLAVGKRSRKYAWLKEYDSMALQQAVINLDTAFKNFFNPKLKSRFPRFKSRHGRQSSYHCVGIKAGDNSIKIPKCSLIKARIHRNVEGRLRSITITRSAAGKYYASLLIDDGLDQPKPVKHVDSITGIDLGLTNFLITDRGHKEANPRFVKRAEYNLRRKQKALSRKKKGSANRSKARLQVAKAYEHVANAREDFQHKLSKTMVDESQAIIVETLKSENMMKNRNLAKAIGDVSWHGFVVKLERKAAQAGKHLVKIDRWYASSKICSDCGHKADKMPLHIRSWQCESCGEVHDRDVNAAINIRNKGIFDLKAAGYTVSAY